MRRVGLVLTLTLLFSGILQPAFADVWRPQDILLELVNAHRSPDVHADWRLDARARAHSREMRDRGRIFHSGYRPCWYRGENVGAVAGGAPRRLRALVNAMMKSPAHRSNIVNPRFHRIGIGAAAGGGIVYVTMIFCS